MKTSKLIKVINTYNSCKTEEHRVITLEWAKRILSNLEMETLMMSLIRAQGFNPILSRFVTTTGGLSDEE